MPASGGMLPRPSLIIMTTNAGSLTWSSGAPPPCPPRPSTPWHGTHAVLNTSSPASTSAAASFADGADGAAGADGADVVSGTAVTRLSVSRSLAGGSVPSSPNIHTLSPFAEPINTLPADSATTYCLPPCSNVVAGAFMPAPVWNSQSLSPVSEVSAVRRPSLRPTNTSPPPVASEPL